MPVSPPYLARLSPAAATVLFRSSPQRPLLAPPCSSARRYCSVCGNSAGCVSVTVHSSHRFSSETCPAWEPGRDPSTNGRLATLRAYAHRAPVVAIGGLVQRPCHRAARHLYLAELVRAFPDTRFWALGQFVG